MAEYVVGIAGASGTALALRFLEELALREEADVVHVVVSPRALVVAATEIGRCDSPQELVAAAEIPKRFGAKLRLHDDSAIAAPISSGSYPTAGMAVVPCSAGTLGGIASGTSTGLLLRAADVTLKERRRLVLAFRESPLSLIHVENLRTVTLAGAIVAPPMPPYYLRGATADDWLTHSANRLLDLLGLPPRRDELRWGKKRGKR